MNTIAMKYENPSDEVRLVGLITLIRAPNRKPYCPILMSSISPLKMNCSLNHCYTRLTPMTSLDDSIAVRRPQMISRMI